MIDVGYLTQNIIDRTISGYMISVLAILERWEISRLAVGLIVSDNLIWVFNEVCPCNLSFEK